MAEEKKKNYPGFPKAKYRLAKEGEGDLKHQYSQERWPYVTAVAQDPDEEKELGKGWFDHPSDVFHESLDRKSEALEEVVRGVTKNASSSRTNA